jgi:hypothetical protein
MLNYTSGLKGGKDNNILKLIPNDFYPINEI